jgi:hypothetical protein
MSNKKANRHPHLPLAPLLPLLPLPCLQGKTMIAQFVWMPRLKSPSFLVHMHYAFIAHVGFVLGVLMQPRVHSVGSLWSRVLLSRVQDRV